MENSSKPKHKISPHTSHRSLLNYYFIEINFKVIALKEKIIVIKNSIVISILLIAIIFFIWSLVYKQNLKKQTVVTSTETIENTVTNEKITPKKVMPQKILPIEIDGFEIIGKLEIPKINLSTYILAETNDDTLSKSVTKLCGANINEAGNFCILGHNYNKTTMFGNLKKIEINDTITITNMYGQKVEYIVYDIYKVFPNEVECLSQETYGNREVTLITCTTGAIKRLVIKATEIYD